MLIFSRSSLLCCAPAPRMMTMTWRPSLFPAAHRAVLSRRSSVRVQSVGVLTLRGGRWRGLGPSLDDLAVRPPVRERGRRPSRWDRTWRPVLKSTSRRARGMETSCRCSASAHGASAWTLRGRQWLSGQQGALSPVRLRNISAQRYLYFLCWNKKTGRKNKSF